MRTRAVIGLAAVSLLCTGCSLFRSKRVDLAPFAEYTISLAADLEYGFADAYEVNYLTEYLDEPTVTEYAREWLAIQELVTAVVAYSLEVTTLSSSLLKEPEQTAALASFLDGLTRPVEVRARHKLELSESKLDSIIADVGTQKKLLDAAAAAQPIVNEIVRVSDRIIDDIRRAQDVAAADVEARIESDFRDELQVRDQLRDWRSNLFRSVALLADHRRGNESALEELFRLNPDIDAAFSSSKLTPKQILQIEDRLWAKLERAQALEKQIAPDITEYRNRRRELREAVRRDNEDLRRAHVAIIVWARAHERLANGVTDPSQLNLLKLGEQAAKLTPWY